MLKFILGTTSLCLCLVAAQAREANFVRPDLFDTLVILPSAPANDSEQTKAELAELHKIEETRTPERMALAKADDAEEDMFIFAGVMGPGFSAANLPLTAKLSAKLHNDESVFSDPNKSHWNRPRPPALDPTLHPICKASNSGAYPSGHTLTGYLEALVLIAMVPEKRDAIFARLDEYGYSRLVCGVHYRSDLEASKRLGYAMIGLLMTNPAFKAEFEPAKAEVRKALGLS